MKKEKIIYIEFNDGSSVGLGLNGFCDPCFVRELENKIKSGAKIEQIGIKEKNPCDISSMSYREYTEAVLHKVDY